MGESKNGAKTQIKRNRGAKESSSSKRGPEHNTGHRRQRPQERRSASNMAQQIHGTHKPEPDRQSAKDAPQLTQEPERVRKRYAFLRERLRADASRPACRHICEGVARYHLNIDVSGAH